jgi:hypothetical protein
VKTIFIFLSLAALAVAAPKRPDVASPIREKQATVPVTTSVRITRVEIIAETAEGTKVVILRERVQTLADGTVLGRAPLATITRMAETTAADKVGAITLDDWLNAAGLFAAKWAAEDAVAKPAASPVAPSSKPSTP